MALENFDIERSDQEMVRRTLLSSMSFWLTITRMLQIALSFTVLFCTGYTANIFLGDWFHTFGLSFVTFIITMLFMFYVRSPVYNNAELFGGSANKPEYRSSAMEIFVTCLWIATVALLSWECQTWDAAEDVVSDVLSSEQAALVNSLPNQDSGILSLRAATALASINCVFWAVTLFICK
ncbi:hypothetical protein IFR05_014312 [Cadophora sp. M221]|nr:hypothetical protein IFR05_014312 [Cadophora sp. M221]